MAQRDFEIVPGAVADKYHRVRIACSFDGCGEQIIFAKPGSINSHQAAHWFRDKGWTVGKDKRGDLCPKHGKRPSKRHKEDDVKILDTPLPLPNGDQHAPGAPHKVIVQLPVDRGFTLPPPVPEKKPPTKPQLVVPIDTPPLQPGPVITVPPPVPELTKLAKRLIRIKMEEVYVDEDAGYKEGWNDERVALDLKLPIEWIAMVRQEDYGPEKGLGLTKIVSGIEEKWGQMQTSMAFIEGLARESAELCKKMDAKMEEYDQQKAELMSMMIEFNRRKN